MLGVKFAASKFVDDVVIDALTGSGDFVGTVMVGGVVEEGEVIVVAGEF